MRAPSHCIVTKRTAPTHSAPPTTVFINMPPKMLGVKSAGTVYISLGICAEVWTDASAVPQGHARSSRVFATVVIKQGRGACVLRAHTAVRLTRPYTGLGDWQAS